MNEKKGKFWYAMGAIFLIALIYTANRTAGITLFILALLAMVITARKKGML